MNIEELLLNGFGSEFFEKIKVLMKENFDGEFDGNNFESISVKGAGKKAFVIKGWVSNSDGPAIRFRARWGELSDGEVFYQESPHDKGWQDTVEADIKLDMEGFTKINLEVYFWLEDDPQDEEHKHVAKFWTT